MMAGTPVLRELFGGAIVAEVPEIFVDASDFRPVPSSQEVFVSSTDQTDISIVIDILERVDLPDAEACKEHLDDVLDGREGSFGKLFQIEGPLAEFANIGGPAPIPVYLVEGTVTTPYHPAPPPTSPDYLPAQLSLPYTLLLMVIFRLEAQNTDLLVTVNCPVTQAADIVRERRVWHPLYEGPPAAAAAGLDGAGNGAGRPVVDDAIALVRGVAGTLLVRDWGLFSPE